MIEITTYKCDYCGEIFNDEEECLHHEWKCRYLDMCAEEDCDHLRLFNLYGTEIQDFSYPDCDEIGAVEVNSYRQARFINDYFEECGYVPPVRIDCGIVETYGLWYYDPEYHYGEWRSYSEVSEDIQKIGKKFNQGA